MNYFLRRSLTFRCMGLALIFTIATSRVNRRSLLVIVALGRIVPLPSLLLGRKCWAIVRRGRALNILRMRISSLIDTLAMVRTFYRISLQ